MCQKRQRFALPFFLLRWSNESRGLRDTCPRVKGCPTTLGHSEVARQTIHGGGPLPSGRFVWATEGKGRGQKATHERNAGQKRCGHEG